MLTPIDYILGSLALVLYVYYAWKTISKQTIKIQKKYLWLGLALFIIFVLTNYSFTNSFLKFTISTIILIIANMVIYKNSVKQALLLSFSTQLILMAGECCYVFIVLVIGKVLPLLSIDEIFGTFFSNIIIACLATLILNIPFVKKTCRKLITKYDKVSNFQMIVSISILMISVNILLALVYSRVDNLMLLAINSILILIYTEHRVIITHNNFNDIS